LALCRRHARHERAKFIGRSPAHDGLTLMLTYDQTFVPTSVAHGPRSDVRGAAPTANLRAVATPADLGLNGRSLTLAGMQLATITVLAVLYAGSSLTIAWSTAFPKLIGLGGLGAVWLYLFRSPSRNRREWVIAESFAVLLLILCLSMIVGVGQYIVALLQRSLVDPYLAGGDAFLGVSVPNLVAWTRLHDGYVVALRLAYFSLLPQFVLAIVGAGAVLRDRDRLWEFGFHFHFCALVTLAASGLFPAECAFTFYGFESLIDQGRFIHHFESLRAGTFQTIRFDQIEGLISFPSFHVAGALMVTWAFRSHRAWLWPLIVLNIGLIAATFMTGAHYVVDVLATVAIFSISVWVYRLLRRSGLYGGS
jgi:PAP2 superfamily